MSALLSIIVPVYKVEQYLPKCIESILNQSFKDFELILVDDGSPDDSGKICDNYAKQDNRIRVMHKENGGLSSARNAGLDIAQGEYIGFVDSDDWIHEEMYQLLYTLAKKRNADIVQCEFKEVFKEVFEEQVEAEEIKKSLIQEFMPLEAMRRIYTTYGTLTIIMCNKLYRRKVFEKNRFEVGRIYEDEFIIHKVLNAANKVVHIGKALYYYRQTNNSITRDKFNMRKMDYILALEQRALFFEEIGEQRLLEYTWLRYENILVNIFYCIWKTRISEKSIQNSIRKKYKVHYRAIKNSVYANKREKVKFRIFRYMPKLCCILIGGKEKL